MKQDNEETKVNTESVKIPDVKYKTLKEAESILKENGLNIKYDGEIEKKDKENIVIKDQVPSSGISINIGSSIKVSF